ncbi:MAG: hypothetical protein DHS20C09_10940 [marine bacterium B5-7]|nr:MAG: hypothetical protein DHS20C09_10940 [marine bacterium B5-7]
MSDRILELLVIVFISFYPLSLLAESPEPEQAKTCAMDNNRLEEIIRRLDKTPEGSNGMWQLKVGNHAVTVITDEEADRMRIVIPITETSELTEKHLYRIMQANFDSALDARYAIAKEILWSAYIHPLSTLSDEDFLSGLGQTVNLVDTFGGTFSSGSSTFIGGDSQGLKEKELIKELLKKGKAI